MAPFSKHSWDQRRPMWTEKMWQDTARKLQTRRVHATIFVARGPMPVSPYLSVSSVSLFLSLSLSLFIPPRLNFCLPWSSFCIRNTIQRHHARTHGEVPSCGNGRNPTNNESKSNPSKQHSQPRQDKGLVETEVSINCTVVEARVHRPCPLQ